MAIICRTLAKEDMKEEFIHDESFILEQFERHSDLFKEQMLHVDDVKSYCFEIF